MLFCKAVPLHAASKAVFVDVNNFMKDNGINWDYCAVVCIDAARAKVGKLKGLVPRIQSVAPSAKSTHCTIHCEAFATRRMPTYMKSVFHDAVKIINFIKCRSLNSRIFTALCQEMGSEHEHLLLHSEVNRL
jgi:hydroxypyruvate isomerase